MGVYAVCGVPGSGKTLFILKKFLIPALEHKRNVYTNIEGLNVYRIAEIFGLNPLDIENNIHMLEREEDSPEKNLERIRYFYKDIDTGEDRPDNSIFIIDEAQNSFGSREFKQQFSDDLIKYITRHRHYGHDVVWATQVLESVDISFRRNTALTYAMRRMEHLGAKNSSFVYVFDRCDLDRKQLTRSIFHFDKKYFQIYDSYVAEGVSEKRRSYNIFLHSPFMWISVLALAWFLYTLLSGKVTSNLFHAPSTSAPEKVEKTVEKKLVDTLNVDSSKAVMNGSLCYKKKVRMAGTTVYYLSDGSSTTFIGYPQCGL